MNLPPWPPPVKGSGATVDTSAPSVVRPGPFLQGVIECGMNVLMARETHVGKVRRTNQDTVLAATDPAGRRGHLLIVADGMGGAQGGEIASRMAVDVVSEVYFSAAGPPPTALHEGVVQANQRIFRAAQTPATHGMGTTCSALALVDAQACIVHVGDSRVYRLRARTLTRLTRVHSVWADQVCEQGLSPVAKSGQNILTRALGVSADVDADTTSPMEVLCGDRYLLCSDGLWGVVTDAEIGRALAKKGVEGAAPALIDLANARGGPDNVSVVVAEVTA